MKTKIYIAALATALALTACDSDWTPAIDGGGRTGRLDPSSLGVEVDDTEILLTKAADYNIGDFKVKIYPKGEDTPVREWTYARTPEIFSLPVGDYRVDVVSHEVQKAAWAQPLYMGSAEFSIADSKITDIGTVTCTFQSIKVSVRFTDELRAVLGDDVKVTVVCNDDGRLEYTPAETRSGYFEAVEGSSTLAARFTGTVKGNAEDIHRVYTDAKAGQHRIITFGLRDSQQQPDPETGLIDPSQGINVSVDVTDEDVNGSVDAGEDNLGGDGRPGGEDFTDPDNPDNPDNPDKPGDDSKVDFVCAVDPEFELGVEHILSDETAAKAVIDITSKYPIAKLVVTIDSSSDDFNETVRDLDDPNIPGEINFDLANPASAEINDMLGGFGLPIADEVKGKTQVKFDVSGLVVLLATFPGTHNFNVTVTDTKGKEFGTALIYKVN